MENNLVELTKQKMGYKERTPACEDCKYHSEEDDQAGVSYDMCNYSNVQPFSVKRRSSCKFFKDKNEKDATERTGEK